MEEKLILDNIPLIYLAIKKLNLYWKTEDEFQEFYDAGLEGLIRGAKKYDGRTKPSTYLYKCIKNMICRSIMLSETDKRKINKEAMISLDQDVNNENDTTFGELIPSEYNLEEEVEKKLQIQAILRELECMKNQKDALCIKMYYGLEGITPMTYKQIADKLGVTQEMVRVRVSRALRKLKEKSEFIERKAFMKENYIEKENSEIISLTEKEDVNKPILEQVTSILLEQLQTLKKLDLRDRETSKMEIAKCNAITSTSKTILQTVGIQMMTEKQKYKFLEYK